jgi:NADH-quinone oxidoreductase subunit J
VSHVTEILMGLLIVVSLWTVQTSILRAAIGLAATSVLLTLVIFHMGAPLAAVFELSVCAGLITVVFVSTISMTRPIATKGEADAYQVKRYKRFHPAIIVAAIVGTILWASGYVLEVAAPPAMALANVRDVLWGLRRLDLIGQITIVFVGVFAVVILFKERREAGR